MAGTFSQIYIHVVFAVKGRENLISKNWKTDLYKYIAGIIRNKDQKPIIIGGMPDHLHVAFWPVSFTELPYVYYITIQYDCFWFNAFQVVKQLFSIASVGPEMNVRNYKNFDLPFWFIHVRSKKIRL